MRVLKSADGYDILVDDDVYERVSKIEWITVEAKQTRYARRRSKSSILLHRAIMGLAPGDPGEIHHRNGDGLDCRRDNMKIVTSHQNSLQRLRDFPCNPHLTPYVGVYYKNISGKERSERPLPWYCDLKILGKKYRRMYFRTAEEANRARNEMISQYITVL